jgi:LuxR family maltose regulon positive regulatory protein
MESLRKTGNAEQFFHSNMLFASGAELLLDRPRIDRLLEKAAQSLACVVTAGAGYGKTQAVYSFVQKRNARTVWMQFSERDNINERFWENFAAGLSFINGKVAAKIAEMNFPLTDRQFERYLRIFQAEVDPKKRYVIVLDDLHFLTNRMVLRFLERSVPTPFSNVTCVFISRSEVPLNFGSLESKGLLARITEEELRFTQEEMLSYFRLLGINPSPRTVSSVYRDTEGWAFAIHLAGLSLKNAPSGDAYVQHALRSNIFKLIASEIMAPLPPEMRRFLIKLSLIEHLVPDLLKELAGDAAIMEGLKELDSFVRFDTYRNSYHIHQLFLDYLKGRQNELSEYDKKDLWHKTATWCAANNQKLDAISYYEKAGDYGRLIGLVETMSPVLPNRIARMLLEIMENAPSEVYDQIAIAHVLRTGLCLTLEMFEEAEKEIAAVIAKLEARPLSPASCKTLTGCYNNLGFIGMITSSYTRKYDYAHYFERARHFYDQSPFETKPPASGASLSSYLCRVNSEEEGEIERYIEGIAAMVATVPFTLGGCTLGMDDLGRGELAFFKADLSGAERFLLRALRSARQAGQYETENRALFYLLRINLARGDYPAIEGILKQLETQLEEQYFLNRFIYYDIVTGWYYAHIGQADKLASWLKNDFEESELNSLAFGLEILVKAKYHFSKNRWPAALAVLENREGQDSRWAFVLGKIEMKALEAVCRYRNRDRKGACAALETAYRLARPNALYMPFAELGKDMRALAEMALKDKATEIPPAWLEQVRLDSSGYAKRLFTVAERYRPVSARRGVLNPAGRLSRRETEVLAGLFQGMTREEIAAQSSLSVNTVKSVIRSVYRKLGAVNRADAVRIAAVMGIVGDREAKNEN